MIGIALIDIHILYNYNIYSTSSQGMGGFLIGVVYEIFRFTRYKNRVFKIF